MPGRLGRLLLATAARCRVLPTKGFYAVLTAHVVVRCTAIIVVIRRLILGQLLELIRLQQPVTVVRLEHSTLLVVVFLQGVQGATVVLQQVGGVRVNF